VRDWGGQRGDAVHQRSVVPNYRPSPCSRVHLALVLRAAGAAAGGRRPPPRPGCQHQRRRQAASRVVRGVLLKRWGRGTQPRGRSGSVGFVAPPRIVHPWIPLSGRPSVPEPFNAPLRCVARPWAHSGLAACLRLHRCSGIGGGGGIGGFREVPCEYFSKPRLFS